MHALYLTVHFLAAPDPSAALMFESTDQESQAVWKNDRATGIVHVS